MLQNGRGRAERGRLWGFKSYRNCWSPISTRKIVLQAHGVSMRVSRFLNFETTSKKKTPGALAASTRDPVLLRVDRHSESLRSVPMFRVIIILYAPINDYFVRSFTVRRGLRCDRSGFENNILKTIELYFFFFSRSTTRTSSVSAVDPFEYFYKSYSRKNSKTIKHAWKKKKVG